MRERELPRYEAAHDADAAARRQRGAALLLALLIMTLVATLAAGMVWLQWRGIEVEAAERARTQAEWLLNASLDWGNLILKSSIRHGHTEDDLGQPWATPLAETKLSSFLSADGKNHDDDSGPEAYLSGQITDAQAKYNLYNLVVHRRRRQDRPRSSGCRSCCTAIGVSPDVATTIAAGLRDELRRAAGNAGPGRPRPSHQQRADARCAVADLAWYGIDPEGAQAARALRRRCCRSPPASAAWHDQRQHGAGRGADGRAARHDARRRRSR